MTFRKNLLLVVAVALMMAFMPAEAQKVMKGKASYYAHKFHGRRSSDGSVYHKDSLTCAHKTLPFGTILRVTNLNNNKEVMVKVTDRGPFCKGRIVDLSFEAARRIGLLQSGVASVEATVVKDGNLLSSPKDDILPELQLRDPATGEFYAASEWAKREQHEREAAKALQMRHQQEAKMAQQKKAVPRYKVLTQQLTANTLLKQDAKKSQENNVR